MTRNLIIELDAILLVSRHNPNNLNIKIDAYCIDRLEEKYLLAN